MSKNDEFNRLLAEDHSKSDEKLFNFFDTLPALNIDEMLSRWKGEDINTGHWVSQAMVDTNWYGKWYKSRLEAIPLVCFNEQKKLYSNQAFHGEASLWMVEFRGVTTTTMVYDGVPVFDHFRKISDDRVMGVMNGKDAASLPQPIIQNGRYFFFSMQRVPEYPTEFVK